MLQVKEIYHHLSFKNKLSYRVIFIVNITSVICTVSGYGSPALSELEKNRQHLFIPACYRRIYSQVMIYLLFLCPRAKAKAMGLYPDSDSIVMSAPLAETEHRSQLFKHKQDLWFPLTKMSCTQQCLYTFGVVSPNSVQKRSPSILRQNTKSSFRIYIVALRCDKKNAANPVISVDVCSASQQSLYDVHVTPGAGQRQGTLSLPCNCLWVCALRGKDRCVIQ